MAPQQSVTERNMRSIVALLNNVGAKYYEEGRLVDAMHNFEAAQKMFENSNCNSSDEGLVNEEGKRARQHSPVDAPAVSCSDDEPAEIKRELDITRGMYREENEDDLGTEAFDTPFKISAIESTTALAAGADSSVVLYNMGLVHRCLGSVDSAVDYFEQSLSSLPENTNGFEHLAVAALNNIGSIHYQLGMYDEAMCDFLQAIKGSFNFNAADNEQHSDDSSLTSAIQCISNKLYPATNAEDIDCIIPQHSSKRRKLSKTKSITASNKNNNNCNNVTQEDQWLLYQATTLSNIGRIDFRSNRFADAFTTCQTALSIRNKILGPESFESAIIRYNIGLIAHKQGQLELAFACYQEFAKIATKLHGPNAAHVATALHQLSLIYSAREKKETALAVLDEVLRVRKSLHGRYHRDIAKTYFSIGQIHFGLKNVDEACKAFKEAIRIAYSVFPSHHIIFVLAFCYMGQIHHSKGNHEDALNSYEHALPVARSIFGNEHYLVINILNIIGNYWVAQGDLVAAFTMFDEASSIYVRSIMVSGQFQQQQQLRCRRQEQQQQVGGGERSARGGAARKCVAVVAKCA